ncbi:RNA polymerase sigma factor [Bythopirellula goksoeyrii]|nr:RNA polymerase sigma factor [Bythopirellula goksoeyrii]
MSNPDEANVGPENSSSEERLNPNIKDESQLEAESLFVRSDSYYQFIATLGDSSDPFLSFFGNLGPELMAFASKQLGKNHADAAEDILQETFQRASLKFDLKRSNAEKRSFLYSIVRNLVADYFRRLKGKQLMLSKLNEKCPPPLPSAEELCSLDEQIALLDKAIEQLDQQSARRIRLHIFDGKNWREIEEELGSPRNTERHRYFQDLKRLRKYLDAQL